MAIGDPRYEGILDDAVNAAGGVIATAGQVAGKVATTAQQVQQTTGQVTNAGPVSGGGSGQGVAGQAAGGGFPWALALGGGAVVFGIGLVWLKRR